jgi:hypothetical protein
METRLERQREKYDVQLRNADALHGTTVDKVFSSVKRVTKNRHPTSTLVQLQVEIAGHAVTREKMSTLEGKLQQRTHELDECRVQLQALHQERAQVQVLGGNGQQLTVFFLRQLAEVLRTEFAERIRVGEGEIERLAALLASVKTEMRAKLATAQVFFPYYFNFVKKNFF